MSLAPIVQYLDCVYNINIFKISTYTGFVFTRSIISQSDEISYQFTTYNAVICHENTSIPQEDFLE